MKRLLIIVLLSVAAGCFIRYNIFETVYVASGSMEPTLQIGQKFIVEKLSYVFRNPRFGEIIVLESPVDSQKELIKRVIAVAGDEIRIWEKDVLVNGHKLKEPYVKYTRWGELLEGDNIGPLTVPAGKVFVMGDNRDESGDSRDWKDHVTGKHIYFVDVTDVRGRIMIGRVEGRR